MISWKMGAGIGAAVGLASLLAVPSAPVVALTMQECSAQYKAAKESGTLGKTSWLEFRKTRCGPGSPSPAAGSTFKPAAGAAGKAVFPQAVSPKYSRESAGKARLHTCLDQYRVNKASNANGGLRWVQKGGGYYSECNKRLKG